MGVESKRCVHHFQVNSLFGLHSWAAPVCKSHLKGNWTGLESKQQIHLEVLDLQLPPVDRRDGKYPNLMNPNQFVKCDFMNYELGWTSVSQFMPIPIPYSVNSLYIMCMILNILMKCF